MYMGIGYGAYAFIRVVSWISVHVVLPVVGFHCPIPRASRTTFPG